MLLGLHCSAREGYFAALEEALAAGCRSMQMFCYQRHQVPNPEAMRRFKESRDASSVETLLIHARYLPALASSDRVRRDRSVELMRQEMLWSRALGADALIIHLGAFSAGASRAEGMNLLAGSLERALEEVPDLPVVIENVPGGGRRMGGGIEELSEAAENLRAQLRPRIGFCLDTAHAWAYGYGLDSAAEMCRFLSQAKTALGLKNILAFHLNYTAAERRSHQEQHEHWGRGRLGLEGLGVLLKDPDFAGIAGILETPKSPEDDRRNLALLRQI